VRVCDSAGAIDFQRAPVADHRAFDLVLDLRPARLHQHQPPQGYLHAGADERRADGPVLELRERVGEFEKPRFFHYKQKLCAHSRNEQIGCTPASTSARPAPSAATRCQGQAPGARGAAPGGRRAAGGLLAWRRIVVEPHLCVGCGACTTVCPSGALAFAYPGTADQGRAAQAC
jgi:ferredoxin